MALAGLLATGILYLLLWPVPIDPVAWQAPRDRGLVDPFGPDARLAKTRLVDIGEHEGPEDVARGPDGLIYASTKSGAIIRLRQNGRRIETFADVGGRPLGIEFDSDGNLLVANAYVGLQRISPGGLVEVLVDTFDGKPIAYADDVAVAPDGLIYFTDASAKFSARDAGGTYEASLLDIIEHGGHGRVFRHDPTTGTTTVLLEGLNFANGIAASDDGRFLLVAETGSYRILRYWLEGPAAGNLEVILDNLPGFPDNINNGLNQRFWIGLVAPRNALLDRLSDRPWLRRVVQRLPAALRPDAVPSSHVIGITGDGDVLMNLRDPTARLPALTGVCETRDALWLSSLFGHRLGRLDKRDLTN